MKRFFKKWGNWLAVGAAVVMVMLNDVAALGTMPIIFGISDAFSGVGTKFKRGNGASNEQFTAIAEVNSIGGPNLSREMIDVTSLDSSDGYREFIPAFRDGGEVTLEMNFTRDSFDELLVDFQSDDRVSYQIIWADTNETQFDFAAYVTGLDINTTTDDKVTATATFKITGAVTLTS